MTKDYKNVSASRATKSSKKSEKKKTAATTNKNLPPWLWMVSGLLIGSFVSFLIFLKMKVPSVENTSHEEVVKIVKPAPAQEKIVLVEPQKEDRFKFYSILPEREVTVPEPVDAEFALKNSLKEKVEVVTTEKGSSQYVLQAGSFARFQDADRRKANLAFIGVISKIHAVEANDKTFYRVRIGPYRDVAQVSEIETMLKQNKISSLRIKVKG